MERRSRDRPATRGFMNRNWTRADIPDLSQKVVVITGANGGLGLASARALADKGATVILACRNEQKATVALESLQRERSDAKVHALPLDNASLDSVRAFADLFRKRYDRLDILLNNAGVMAIPRALTVDRFEMQFGVNHLAHFALTSMLLGIITRTPGARIHNVTSSASFTGDIDFDDPMGETQYGRWKAYGQSKLANVLFTFELQRRLRIASHDTIVNTSHPGLVLGNLQANSVAQSGTTLEAWGYRLMRPILAQDIRTRELPMLFGMAAPEARGGVLYGPRWFNLHGRPAEKRPPRAALDLQARARLWALSETLTGVQYGLPSNG